MRPRRAPGRHTHCSFSRRHWGSRSPSQSSRRPASPSGLSLRCSSRRVGRERSTPGRTPQPASVRQQFWRLETRAVRGPESQPTPPEDKPPRLWETRGPGPAHPSAAPELLDLAGGALQALEHQEHAAIAKLVGAQAELRQGRVGLQRGPDVLAAHLREAAVVQPAGRHTVTARGSREASRDRAPGKKATGAKPKAGCKGQTLSLSLLSGRGNKLQVLGFFSFSTQIYKRVLIKLCVAMTTPGSSRTFLNLEITNAFFSRKCFSQAMLMNCVFTLDSVFKSVLPKNPLD